EPLFVIAFTSPELDIYAISDVMTSKGWSLNGLQLPPALHLAVTLRHTQPGHAERFIQDLKEAIACVKGHPELQGSMTPVYGLMANLGMQDMVKEFLKGVLDMVYTV
ncbi:MAG: hypothetical protein PHS96_04470, partial [Anaerolineales bacterium]|nr:hypothetical protein [Anaerolineales bacterium]